MTGSRCNVVWLAFVAACVLGGCYRSDLDASGDAAAIAVDTHTTGLRVSSALYAWDHFPITTAPSLLLVVVVVDADAITPRTVTVNGAPMTIEADQSAASYGAITMWSAPLDDGRPVHIEVEFAADQFAFTHSVTILGSGLDVQRTVVGQHTFPIGNASIASGDGDLALGIVSRGNTKHTQWQDGSEVWNETITGAIQLGSSAVVKDGAAGVDFAWTNTEQAETSGAFVIATIGR